MPKPLDPNAPPSTLADHALLLAFKNGCTSVPKTATVQTLDGMPYAVFEDNTCIPVFKNKLGHIACSLETGDTPWYPFTKSLMIAPAWLNSIATTVATTGLQMADTYRKSLTQLLDGAGTRISLAVSCPTPTRNNAITQPIVRLTGTPESITPTLEAAIAQKIRIPRMTAELTRGWQPGTPLVKGLDFFTISFTSTQANSAHTQLQKLDTFLHG